MSSTPTEIFKYHFFATFGQMAAAAVVASVGVPMYSFYTRRQEIVERVSKYFTEYLNDLGKFMVVPFENFDKFIVNDIHYIENDSTVTLLNVTDNDILELHVSTEVSTENQENKDSVYYVKAKKIQGEWLLYTSTTVTTTLPDFTFKMNGNALDITSPYFLNWVSTSVNVIGTIKTVEPVNDQDHDQDYDADHSSSESSDSDTNSSSSDSSSMSSADLTLYDLEH